MTQETERYWGSHLAPLLACIGATHGPVLEVGIGHFSTPVLHALCGAMGRKLVSVEDNLEWIDQFKERYSSDKHTFIHADYDNVIPLLAVERWSVAFIDNSPGGERRKKDFISLIGHSDYVVLHDFEHDNSDAILPILTQNKSIAYLVSRSYLPPTLVASSTKIIPQL